jgi:uncharacterized protein (TIGR02996 family)
MPDDEAFLRAMAERPADLDLRLVFADWLEERGDPRAELLRLLHTLTRTADDPKRPDRENRLRNLLASGARPVGPFIKSRSCDMQFACVVAGRFRMGSPEAEAGRRLWEGPQHEVTIPRPFWMGVYPVTQGQYRKVMGYDPSALLGERGDGPDHPVRVRFRDAWALCERLSEGAREKGGGRVYRLPSEAEWEYACRAGTQTEFPWGRWLSSGQANFDGNYPYGGAAKGPRVGQTTPVGSYRPNAFGLHDMPGNVWEWCQDGWHDSYQGAPRDWRPWHSRDERIPRVLRGGSWDCGAVDCRAASRDRGLAYSASNLAGFRVVLTSR